MADKLTLLALIWQARRRGYRTWRGIAMDAEIPEWRLYAWAVGLPIGLSAAQLERLFVTLRLTVRPDDPDTEPDTPQTRHRPDCTAAGPAGT